MTNTEQYLIPSTTTATFTRGDVLATLTINTAANTIVVDITAPDYNVTVDHPTHGVVNTDVDIAIDWASFDDLAKAIAWAEEQIARFDDDAYLTNIATEMLMDELDNEEPVED